MSLGFRDHVVLVERDAVFAASRVVGAMPRNGRRSDIWRMALRVGGTQGCAQMIECLPRGRLSRLDRLHVLAGFGFAHHQVVPWPQGAHSPDDLAALAAARFAARFDDMAREWKIAITPGTFGSRHIAVAMDGDWLGDIGALVMQARLRWVSCRSVLHEVVRRTPLPHAEDATVAVRHPGGVSCVLRRGGEWQDACALPLSGQTVAQTLESAQTLCGVEPAPVWLFDVEGNDRERSEVTHRHAATPHPWLWEPTRCV